METKNKMGHLIWEDSKMNFEGKLVGKDLKLRLLLVDLMILLLRLLEGAKDTLIRHEVEDTNIDVAYVPGAFEIPLVAKN